MDVKAAVKWQSIKNSFVTKIKVRLWETVVISILIKIIVSILLAIISVWWWDVGGKSLSCRMGFSWIFLSFSLTIFSALFASEDETFEIEIFQQCDFINAFFKMWTMSNHKKWSETLQGFFHICGCDYDFHQRIMRIMFLVNLHILLYCHKSRVGGRPPTVKRKAPRNLLSKQA